MKTEMENDNSRNFFWPYCIKSEMWTWFVCFHKRSPTSTRIHNSSLHPVQHIPAEWNSIVHCWIKIYLSQNSHKECTNLLKKTNQNWIVHFLKGIVNVAFKKINTLSQHIKNNKSKIWKSNKPEFIQLYSSCEQNLFVSNSYEFWYNIRIAKQKKIIY